MYTPPVFQESDTGRVHELIRRHPFCTLVTGGGGLLGSHLPLLLRPEVGPRGQLVGHMARANPQWAQLAEGREVLAIFLGPHAYVSPSWYEDRQGVPTWNYVAVHAYGVARVFDDPGRLRPLVEEMVAVFEAPRPRPWRLEAPDEVLQPLLGAIVGFEIDITRWDAKLKLSQNRAPADRAGVIRGLAESGDPGDGELARWMRALALS